MALTIKKEIDLGEIADEYNGITLMFRSVPAVLLTELAKKEDSTENKGSNAIKLYLDTVKEYFISGKQNEDEISKDDLDNLDGNSLLHCYTVLVGGGISPKVNSSSTTASSTEEQSPQK